jgi:hypothetical protein
MNDSQQRLDNGKRLKARLERMQAKRDGNEADLGLYIRIGQSSLYDWKPTFRSILLMICYMTVQGDSTIAKPKVKSRKYVDYDGWCWASQETLAMRVGCCERWVREAIKQFKADGVIEIRTWRDRWGRPHNEYRIVESKVDEAQRDFEEPRPKCEYKARKPNSGTFSKSHQPKRITFKSLDFSSETTEAIGSLGREPQEALPVGHRKARPSPIGTLAREPQEVTAVEVGFGVGVELEVPNGGARRTYPASRGQTSLSLRSKTETQNQNRGGDPHTPQLKSGSPVAKLKSMAEMVSRPEPRPLDPEDLCPVCHEDVLNCNHPLPERPLSFSAKPLPTPSPSSAAPLPNKRISPICECGEPIAEEMDGWGKCAACVLGDAHEPTRAVFEVEEDLG